MFFGSGYCLIQERLLVIFMKLAAFALVRKACMDWMIEQHRGDWRAGSLAICFANDDT